MAIFVLQKYSELLIFIKDNIVLYNYSNGQQKVVQIPEPIASSTLKNSKQNRKVVSARLSNNLELLAVILDNKQMIIYDKHFDVICNIVTNRSCSNLRFTNENDVIVTDKTGDLYYYKLKNIDDPVLLLGHLSMLLDVAISRCGRYLITCDRDEKIRVSCFPNCYNIASYCLGHTEFVTNLEIDGNVLISASGDGSVRLWDFIDGKQLSITKTNDYIEDKTIVERFCKEMDDEKVDIQTVPVMDMKIHRVKDNLTIVAVSLLDYNGIQIYYMQVSPPAESSLQFSENIMVQSKVLAFSLTSQLFILTSSSLFMYNLNNNRYVHVNSFSLNQICNDREVFEEKDDDNSNISALYKRKYDNVQEYLEKKKLRLTNM